MALAPLLLFAVLVLSFWNGANDVSKGIATLAGSGVTKLKTAVAWGTVWTVAGALTAALLGGQLVMAFSGSGIVPEMPEGHGFRLAVAIGAVVWTALATVFRMPVSTTHALTGALVGAGLATVGVDGLAWGRLVEEFVLPLAVSPLLALAMMYVFQPQLGRGLVALAGRSEYLDGWHWLSSGTVSFARGLNDAPKILGLGLAAALASGCTATVALVLVAVAMGFGSALAGGRVTETLATKVTPMTPAEGCAANTITALLVIVASRLGVPVSTTHVSSSAIVGMGLKHDHRAVRWTTVRDMLLAWVVTLPVAALVAGLLAWLLTGAQP